MTSLTFDLSSSAAPPRTVSTTANADKRLLHERTYDIKSYLEDESHIRLVGFLQDSRPHFLPGIDDDPVTMHDMQIDLIVEMPNLVIRAVQVQMHTHPQQQCPNVLGAYQQLVGLSIVRGFTHKVREFFGGPRACTHIGALLNAMAPVATQSLWAYFEGQTSVSTSAGAAVDDTYSKGLEWNRDTCHVWASDGPMFALLARGETPPIPVTISRRLEKNGLDVDGWRARRSSPPTRSSATET